MSGDGDGWVICAAGHRHWGLFGAAGILISDGERAILQHRAPWTHEGGMWGLPGGARDSHEDPISTALREADEEAEIGAASVVPVATWVDDHGGWSYTTVLADAVGPIAPHAANAESTDVRWWDKGEIDALPLHHGLAAIWSQLRDGPRPLSIVVDCRADPHFAELATRTVNHRLDLLDLLIRHGVPVTSLPAGLDSVGMSTLLGRVTLVGHGRVGSSAPEVEQPIDAPWWRRAVTVVSPGADATAATLRTVSSLTSTHQVVVVTADGSLRNHLAAGSTATPVAEPDWFTQTLNRHASG